MRANWLSNRVFKSFDDIVDHCCYAWNTLIDQPWKIMSVARRDWAAVGHSICGINPAEAAALEAREEGGLVGRIGDRSIGSYHYDKRLPDGSIAQCVVEVFALEVERQMKSWPEQVERSTRWFFLQEAAEAVQEPELRSIIRSLTTMFPEG
jgi:8-oxo-dGTP pyrophosphatase MutT (NUDIX family)